jgi:phosphohistidine phosphatase SixA
MQFDTAGVVAPMRLGHPRRAHTAERAHDVAAELYLVRHADAGDRATWAGDDRRRPLSERGQRQAEKLIRAFAEIDLTRVVSSPYDRCVQTVQPLALSRGLRVETTEALVEDDAALSQAFVLSVGSRHRDL